MFTAFAAIALVMAVVGIYATLSYLMAQRRRELAIRIALGAAPRDVGRLVVGELSYVLILGLAFGVCAAGLAARALQALLFGITSLAPGVFAGSLVVLGLAVVAAMTPPLLRAIRQDPTAALRVE
jgi:ABC-type antimicrobial peptide transport system permease subunit